MLVALDAASVAVAGHVDHGPGFHRHLPAHPEGQRATARRRQRRTALDGHVGGGDLGGDLRFAFENQRVESFDGVLCL